MDQEHHDEWYGLMLRAMEILAKGSNVEGIGISRLLQVIEKPSFAPASSWEIFEQHPRSAPTTHFCIRLRWRNDLDLEKFRNPVERLKHVRTLNPTIETHRMELNASFVSETCLMLSQIAVPAYAAEKTVGLDGTSYELAFGNSFSGARFYWWGNPSGHMKALAEATLRITEELEAL